MKTENIIRCALWAIFFFLLVAIAPFAYAGYGDHDGPYGENDGIHGGYQSGGTPDPRIKGWATQVVDYWRPSGINFGTPDLVLGQPGGTFDVLSLGDSGWIIVTFDQPIGNGDGPDFAVWENGFISRTPGFDPGLLWAEFMFVEVSTDGVNFIRFPSVNLIPHPIGGFGCIDPTYVHNVAGKHPNGNDDRDQGTPFDLNILQDHPLVTNGTVDLNNILYVKLIDVVGDGSTYDSLGNPMYDPYPTPFGTGGADLDAVGVLNEPFINHFPPDKPILLAPSDGEIGVPLSPALETGPFSDGDLPDGDFHSGTRWHISKDPDFSELVMDIKSRIFLSSLTLTGPILEKDTHYYWRVRFFDSCNAESEWSEIFSFTTTEVSSDSDSNGIPDDQELEHGSLVDLNGDKIPDIFQMDDHFKVLNTVVGEGQMGIETGSGVTIEYIESIDPADIPDKSSGPEPSDMFLGVIGFRLRVQYPGDSTTITVYISRPGPSGYEWYKNDLVTGWYPFRNATFGPDRRSLTLQLQDGGDGDVDGVANGVIVDPGGAGTIGSGGGSNPPGFEGVGGCFIATTGFGLFMEQ
jgi:hypothetical protein